MTDSAETAAAAAVTAAPAAPAAPAPTPETAPASTEGIPGQEGRTAAIGSDSNSSMDKCKERENGSNSSNSNDDSGCVVPPAEEGNSGENPGTARGLGSGGFGDGSTADAADAAQAKQKRPARIGSVRQGRKEKRKAAWEAKKAMIKEKKREQRERREEAMRKEGKEIPVDGKDYRDLPQEQWSVSQRIRHARRQEFEALSTEGGYRVCIDMAFDELMLAKAQASLVQQVLYAYGANRKAAQPCRMTLSGMGTVMDAKVRKLQGFDEWLGVATDSRCYTEIFDKEELVYLTADSRDTITHLEKGKVYVLGGLVDRNAHKGLCFKKAEGQGIKTAKLPLNKEDLHGTHSKVLATNHVFDILLRAMGAGGEVGKVEEKSLPPRKRAGWVGGDDRGPSSMPLARQSDLRNPKKKLDETPPNTGSETREGGAAVGEANPNEAEEGKGGGAAAGGAATPSSAEGAAPPSAAPLARKSSDQENAEATEPERNSPDKSARMEAEGKDSVGEVGVKSDGKQEEVMKVKVEWVTSEAAAGKREVEEGSGGGKSPGADAKRHKTESGGVA